jgi:hypothetical protein
MRGSGDTIERFEDRTWRGKPREQHYETLYRWKWHDGALTYFVLIQFGREFTDDDYGREISNQDAAKWLLAECYDLPDDLKGHAQVPTNASFPVGERVPGIPLATLTDALQEVWDKLANRFATGKELAKEILGDALRDGVIRKRIAEIRKTGREIRLRPSLGYYRPDAPPPEFVTTSDCEIT